MHLRAALETSLLIGVAIAAWLFLGPVITGGPVAYTVISGSSMEPSLHRGDLAVLRIGDRARVGDVYGYHTEQGQTVLHRVLANDPEGFTFKGDNNPWIDSGPQVKADLLGRLWFRVPHVGTAFTWINDPLHTSLIAGGVVAMIAFTGPSGSPSPRHRGSRLRLSQSRRRRFDSLLLSAAGPSGQMLLGVLIALTLIGGAIGLFAWRAVPAYQELTLNDAYEQSGTFSYSARTILPTTPIVPIPGQLDLNAIADEPLVRTLLGELATTGDPLFVNVNPTVDITFDYRFEDVEAEDLAGTVELEVVLGDVTGWKRTFPFHEPTSFSGENASITVRDTKISSFMALLPVYQAITGHAPRYFTAVLLANVEITGTRRGEPFTVTFTPSLVFTVSPPNDIFVETDATQRFDIPGLPSEGTPADPFRTVRAGATTHTEVVPNTVPVLGHQFEVRDIRWLAIAVGCPSLTLALVVLALGLLARGRGRAFMVHAKYGADLVPLSNDGESLLDRPSIQIALVDDLAHIAYSRGAPIFFEVYDDHEAYFVLADGHLFLHEIRSDGA